MEIYLIFCFCLLRLRVMAAVELNVNVNWTLSELGESHYDTCKRLSLLPIQMENYPMIWNFSKFEQVVHDLKLNIISNSSYGISGCCSPGLWCSSAGCFTQGFGAHFSNYGWLNNDISSYPVYTCSDSNISSIAQISNQTLISDVLTISGINLGTGGDSVVVGLDTEMCENVESCTCQSCLGDSDSCPLGQQCLHIDKDHYWNCFATCAGSGDDSCPCGYVCTPFSGTSLCIPQSLVSNPRAESSHSMACAVPTLQCHIPRAYQAIYATQTHSEVFLIVDIGSSAAVTTLSNLVKGRYCETHSDCQDGNVCTSDACDLASGLCVYSSVGGCDSTPQAIRQQAAPYAYRDLYFRNRTIQHQMLKNQLLRNNTKISMSTLGSHDVSLSFSMVFFGNLVSRAAISSAGVVSLPPVNDCTAEDAKAQQCILFSTSTNVIAPWFAAWNASASGAVSIRLQSEKEEETVHGLRANALHVLFSDMVPEGAVSLTSDQSNSSSFSASLYEDGSVRLSYLQVQPLHAHFGDFSGLWGSVVTEEATNGQSRYHMENVSRELLGEGGVDVLYCPFSTVACIPQSCVTAGDVLTVRWNGTDSCSALGGNGTIALYCEWAGGAVPRTYATLVPSINNTEPATVTCAVPFLDFSDGEVLTVDLVAEATTSESADQWRYFPEQRVVYESRQLKTVYSAVLGNGTELARTNLQVRYFNSSGGERGSCGCSALPAFGGYTCDSLNVCGGDGTTKDCAGSPFGSAYQSACGACSGGLTGVTPVFVCPSSGSGGNFLSLISQTIILLMIICCMTFITSTASFSIRRMLANRHMDDGDDVFEDYMGGDLTDVERTTSRGLSEFECEALGQVVFSTDFYVAHKKAQLEAMHGVHGVVASEKTAVVAEASAPPASSSSCDCPICLMDILEGNVCRVLPDPCGHVFHMACIDQWFKQSTVCPLCKRNMKSILEGEDEDDHFPVRANVTGRGYRAVNAPPHRPFVAMQGINRIRNSLFQQSAADRGLPTHRPADVAPLPTDVPSSASLSPVGIAMTRLASDRPTAGHEEGADLVRNRERGAVDL